MPAGKDGWLGIDDSFDVSFVGSELSFPSSITIASAIISESKIKIKLDRGLDRSFQ
jgi:hypothetical protein